MVGGMERRKESENKTMIGYVMLHWNQFNIVFYCRAEDALAINQICSL